MTDFKGTLSISDKIWFNDRERCKLRICGLNKEQIKKLESGFGLIDITIINHDESGYIKAHMHISDKVDYSMFEDEKPEDCDSVRHLIKKS